MCSVHSNAYLFQFILRCFSAAAVAAARVHKSGVWNECSWCFGFILIAVLVPSAWIWLNELTDGSLRLFLCAEFNYTDGYVCACAMRGEKKPWCWSWWHLNVKNCVFFCSALPFATRARTHGRFFFIVVNRFYSVSSFIRWILVNRCVWFKCFDYI